jgi:hypothetical protein
MPNKVLVLLLAVSAATHAAPEFPLQQKVIGSDTAYGDHFGAAVALDADTLAVGAPGHDANRGAVYLFLKTAGVWHQVQELQEPDTTFGDGFGRALLFQDGTLLVNGAKAIYVYTVSEGLASRIAELGPPTSNTTAFGYTLSYDGIHIMTPGTDTIGGYAVIFTKGTDWQNADLDLLRPPSPSNYFGSSTVVQGPYAMVGDFTEQKVYVYHYEASSWNQQQVLTGPADFGRSAATCSDELFVGGNVNAFVYGQTASGWTLRDMLIQPAPVLIQNSTFPNWYACNGTSLLLTATGNRQTKPQVLVFNRTGTSWMYRGRITQPDGHMDDQFGNGVGLSRDTAAIGAPFNDSVTLNSGVVYVFSGVPVNSPPCLIDVRPAYDNAGLNINVNYDLWSYRPATWTGTFYCVGAYSYEAWSEDFAGGAPVSGARTVALPKQCNSLQLVSTLTLASGRACTDAQYTIPPP